MIRQGDVLLKPVQFDTKGKKPIAKDLYTLALGEQTGHHHDIVGDVEVFQNGQAIILNVESAQLTHQEHAHLEVPKGMYEVVNQREYSMLDEVQLVRD